MLKAISWEEYFEFIAVTLILYYSFLFIFYFRLNFSSLLSGNWKFMFRSKVLPSEVLANSEKVIKEIGPCFRGKGNIRELIDDLQLKLEPYKFWDEPDFRKNINDFIIKESEKEGSIHLNEEDLRVLWL